MSELELRPQPAKAPRSSVELVDADIHPTVPAAAFKAYLPERTARHLERFGRRSPKTTELYPRAANAGMRADSWPDEPGVPPGGSLEWVQRQVLDEYGVDYGVLNCMTLLDCFDPPGVALDLARASNDWMQEEWLERDPRMLGAIVVPADYPELAVGEVERLGRDPRWVQVMFPGSPQEALGSQKYWPIYEAAAALGLTIGVHNGGYDAHSGTGWPSYYLEEHVAYAFVMQKQLLDMAAHGVFDRFPDLKVVLIEGGAMWAASLAWALDEAWALLPDDLPRVERKPSEAIHDQVWFTTQPIDEPDDPRQFTLAMEHGNLGERLLFATDYPHWDFDSPTGSLPSTLGKEERRRILFGNACELYGLPL